MMVFSTKARQAKALIGDIVLGTADDKPWTIEPTPDPQIPQDVVAAILKSTTDVVVQAQSQGITLTPDEIRLGLREVKDAVKAMVLEEAKVRCGRAEVKIEDLLAEGGFIQALDAFIDDLTTYKTAFIKGPVVRKRGALQWQPGPNGTSIPVVTYENLPDWERTDPLMMYPAPWAKNVQDGYLIERHKLSPSALSDMIGVEGYNEDAIRQVLDQYAQNGLHEWLQVDNMRLAPENRMYSSTQNNSDLIDALQYWGQVTGKLLREWGMGADQVPDEAKVYDVECWLIGSWVIKAVINSDPLAKRPYFGQSFEPIPGAFWGNSLYDKMRDVEDMCNAAARALATTWGFKRPAGLGQRRSPSGGRGHHLDLPVENLADHERPDGGRTAAHRLLPAHLERAGTDERVRQVLHPRGRVHRHPQVHGGHRRRRRGGRAAPRAACR